MATLPILVSWTLSHNGTMDETGRVLIQNIKRKRTHKGWQQVGREKFG